MDAWARVSPRKLDFGRIEADSSKTLSRHARPTPRTWPVEVTPKLVGADRDEFSTEPVTLGPGEQRELPVTFTPVRVGKKQVALAVSPCRGCADVPVQVAAEALERAVVAEPPVLDFGAVPVDRTAPQGAPAQHQHRADDGDGAGRSRARTRRSAMAPAGFPLVLQPGRGARAASCATARATWAPAAGQRRLPRGEQAPPHHGRCQLRGYGGAAELCVSPLSHDFGAQPLGSKTARHRST